MSKHGVNKQKLVVDQKTAAEATVMIWNSAKGLGALGHPGHASVFLRRTMNTGPWALDDLNYVGCEIDPDSTTTRYVSFWPGGGAKKNTRLAIYAMARQGEFQQCHLVDYFQELGRNAHEGLGAGKFQPKEGQVVIGSRENGDDVWGQAPQKLIHLPALSPSTPGTLGVNLNWIVTWAAGFKASKDFNYTYISRSQNCSGVAMRALAAGGADIFAAIGKASGKASIYLTPNDCERWAEGVARGIAEVNTAIAYLRNAAASLNLAQSRSMPTLDEWKRSSDVGTMRGRITRNVDDALADYQKAQKKLDGLAQLEAIVTLIMLTYDHLRRDSARNDAYKRLGHHLVGRVALFALGGGKPWDPNSFAGEGRDFTKFYKDAA